MKREIDKRRYVTRVIKNRGCLRVSSKTAPFRADVLKGNQLLVTFFLRFNILLVRFLLDNHLFFGFS
jgi:hypothetical protein